MLNYFSSFILFFAFCSFTIAPIDYPERLEQLMSKHIELMKSKYKMRCYGTGYGVANDVNLVSLDYVSDEIFSHERARVLLVSCIEELRQLLNEDKFIRPHLHTYPYSTRNLHVTIEMQPDPNKGDNPNDVYTTYIMNNDYIVYEKFNFQTDQDERLLVEPYKDVLKKAAGQISLTPSKLNLKPTYRTELKEKGTHIVTRVENLLIDYSEDLAKDFNMQFFTNGSRRYVDSNNAIWSLGFINRNQVSVEEGRKLITSMLEKMLSLAKSEPLFQERLHDSAKHSPNWDIYKKPLGLIHFGFKIDFWNDDVEHYPPPYLAQIKVADEVIHYYSIDAKTKEFVEIATETFEEATRKTKDL